MIDKPIGAGTLMRRSISGNRHPSCEVCYAPGTYSSDPSVRYGLTLEQATAEVQRRGLSAGQVHRYLAGWAACYVEPGDPRVGQAVGDTCPVCGSVRPGDIPLGEFAVQDFRGENHG